MKNQENEFSPEQSLKLITSMIETTKNSICDNSIYFLLWGWGILIACAVQYYMKAILNNPNNGMAWLIIPVLVVLQIFLVFKRRGKAKVKTFISDASAYLWTAIGFAYLAMAFIFAKTGWEYCSSFYIILYGMGTFVSGQFIKFRPLIIGGIICLPLAIAAVYVDFDSRILILGLSILVSYIIPGHLLRAKYKKQNLVNV
ncbi:MAG: hypothetical protein JST47_02895 [Bacteroidetes bacterium]|nr:hypothetical protein [Bacteroidota bacterium]MBS1973301.1 hypothetical protein [Bacteroidota bacterium]